MNLRAETEFSQRLKDRFNGFAIRNAWPNLTEMRQVKSPYEIKMLKTAVDITGDALASSIQNSETRCLGI